MYERLRDQNQVFGGLLASGRTGRLDAEIGDGPEEQLTGRMVSGNFFEVLGVQPCLGRAFTAEEDRKPGASPVVVMSYGYWEKQAMTFPLPACCLARRCSLSGTGWRGWK